MNSLRLLLYLLIMFTLFSIFTLSHIKLFSKNIDADKVYNNHQPILRKLIDNVNPNSTGN
jgi:hypothetical protein